MNFQFDYIKPQSPLIEMIWRTTSTHSGMFTSTAGFLWEMVITKMQGKTTLTLRGPETRATPADTPEHAEFIGIVFKIGTFMPHLPVSQLVDTGVHLHEEGRRSFTLYGSSWQFPTFDNADVFVDRLVRSEILVREPLVESVLQGDMVDLSTRSVQRTFLRATGLTHSTIRQIERARRAVSLLQQGTPILDVVYETGYADQPHLTRALKHLMGQTPAQIINANKPANKVAVASR